jgi:DNA-3-methyladenine glycosylase II
MSFDRTQTRRALRHLRESDPVMRALIARIGPFQMRRQRLRFQSLARAILAQQISGTAARSIFGRLQAAVRPRRVTAESVARLTPLQLRSLGISPQKVGYLQDLTSRVLDRSLRLDRLHRLEDDDVIARLTEVRGIGVWTAQMFLMFSLGRLDVFPHDDLGIRLAVQSLYGLPQLPGRSELQEIGAPWRPYATVACWYLWRSCDVRASTGTARTSGHAEGPDLAAGRQAVHEFPTS